MEVPRGFEETTDWVGGDLESGHGLEFWVVLVVVGPALSGFDSCFSPGWPRRCFDVAVDECHQGAVAVTTLRPGSAWCDSGVWGNFLEFG